MIAVVDVERILRRLKATHALPAGSRLTALEIVRYASMAVHSSILYATVIIVRVFMPLFAMPGTEGWQFVPLGIAFIVSTLASICCHA